MTTVSPTERLSSLIASADIGSLRELAARLEGTPLADELRRAMDAGNKQADEDDWRAWLEWLFPDYFSVGFAPHQVKFWEWLWSIETGVKPTNAFIGCWSRGGGKSMSAEAGVVALGARRCRRYVLYISETQEQADDHVGSIGTMLESQQIADSYPALSDRMMSKFGSSRGWRRNRLRTADGFTVDALGLDTAARGIKLDMDRPDLMCHTVGTRIFDEGRWLYVEDHPGLLGLKEGAALAVRVWGVPDPEIVTPDHRYWVRPMSKAQWTAPAAWTEAQTLRRSGDPNGPKHAIGCPIDRAVEPPQAVWVGETKLRTIESNGTPSWRVRLQMEIPEEFADPEWWWLIGLWWGDGTVSRGGGNSHSIAFAIADIEPEIAERVRTLLAQWGYSWNETQRKSCISLTFSCRWMHRWFLEQWRCLEADGSYRAGQKSPPRWVERVDPELQRAMIRGYIDADGCVQPNGVTVVSVSLAGMLCARRILARLGIPATVRLLREAREQVLTIRGVTNSPSQMQRCYDLRIRWGVETLGIEGVKPATRYSRATRTWIEDDWLWSLVRSVEEAGDAKFAPIRTTSGSYLTAFGLSHNCFDDIDSERDGPGQVQKKVDSISKKLLPAGSEDVAVLGIQNLVHPQGVFARLVGIADVPAEFLTNRIVSGPIPALRDAAFNQVEGGGWKIVAGEPSWEGQNVERCQAQVDDWGYTAFLAEAQHDTDAKGGGMFDHIVFAHCTRGQVPALTRVEVWCDPAVTNTDKSDSMAVQCDGLGTNGTIYRLRSWEHRASPVDAIKLAICWAYLEGSRTVGIETDQGGDTWRSVYKEALKAVRDDLTEALAGNGTTGIPEYVQAMAELSGRDPKTLTDPFFAEAKAGSTRQPKEHRIQLMLTGGYEREAAIVHVTGTHAVLERALFRFPARKPYDLADAAYWAWRHISMYGQPVRTNAPSKRPPAFPKLPITRPGQANPKSGPKPAPNFPRVPFKRPGVR